MAMGLVWIQLDYRIQCLELHSSNFHLLITEEQENFPITSVIKKLMEIVRTSEILSSLILVII